MGCRRQSRAATILSVNLCGTDSQGRAFIERVCTRNISRNGALLEGVVCPLVPGDVVVLRCEENTGRFRVIWRQDDPGAKRKRLGLLRLPSANRTEDEKLPVSEPDDYLRPRLQARRQHPRHKHELAAELRFRDIPTAMWVTSLNLSAEGCSVQTGSLVPPATELNLGLWLGEIKIWAQGVVVSSLYGFGTGIRFTGMSRQDRQELKNFLAQKEAEISDRRESEAGSQGEASGFRKRLVNAGQSEEFTVSVPLVLPEGSTVLY